MHNRNLAEGRSPFAVPLGLTGESVPCVFPRHCNTLASRGYSPTKVFCPRCPRFEECTAGGYLSQFEKMREHDTVFLSYSDDFFSDPKWALQIEKIAQGKREFVLVLDEVDPAALPPRREVSQKALQERLQAVEGYDVEVKAFLSLFLKETSVATHPSLWAEAVRSVLGRYPEREWDALIDALEGVPCDVRIENVSVEDSPAGLNGYLYRHLAHLTYKNKTVTAAVIDTSEKASFEMQSELPYIDHRIRNSDGSRCRLSKENFVRLFVSLDAESLQILPVCLSDVFRDLRTWTKEKSHACHPNENGWAFYLRPGMNAPRGVLISASGVVDLIKELYSDSGLKIKVVDGEMPAWKKGCRLYQLSTGRYLPRQSLFSQSADGMGELKPRGKEMLAFVSRYAQRLKKKKILVVVPKALTLEGCCSDADEVVELFRRSPNVTVVNHYHAEGTNEFEDRDTVFIFHFEPRPDEIEKIARRIYRDADLSFEREEITLQRYGVALEKTMRYTDARVQAVYDKECTARLMQALLRLRQMIHENKDAFLLTSEPVQVPVCPLLFTLPQMDEWLNSNTDDFQHYLAETAETEVEALLDAGIPQSTAYRRTEKARAEDKVETDAELLRQILEHKAQGVSQRESANRLDISLGRLQSLLKKSPVT